MVNYEKYDRALFAITASYWRHCYFRTEDRTTRKRMRASIMPKAVWTRHSDQGISRRKSSYSPSPRLLRPCCGRIPRIWATLSSDRVDIVCDPSFETALVKVQKSHLEGEPLRLSRKEKASIKHFLKPTTATETDHCAVEENVDLIGWAAAIRRLNKRKLDSPNESTQYIDIRFVLPTTNVCERMLSTAGFTYSKTRQSLLPENL